MSHRTDRSRTAMIARIAFAVAAVAALGAACADDVEPSTGVRPVETTSPTVDPGHPEPTTTTPTTTQRGPFDQGPIGRPITAPTPAG